VPWSVLRSAWCCVYSLATHFLSGSNVNRAVNRVCCHMIAINTQHTIITSAAVWLNKLADSLAFGTGPEAPVCTPGAPLFQQPTLGIHLSAAAAAVFAPCSAAQGLKDATTVFTSFSDTKAGDMGGQKSLTCPTASSSSSFHAAPSSASGQGKLLLAMDRAQLLGFQVILMAAFFIALNKGGIPLSPPQRTLCLKP
jgi:hypothetical protein